MAKALYSPCSICPDGTLIKGGTDSLKIPSISNGGTCKSVASMAMGGCFDEVHCVFLQHSFKDTCCVKATSDLPKSPSADVLIDTENNEIVPDESCKGLTKSSLPNSIFPGSNDSAACYNLQGGDGSTDELCLENIFGEMCLGMMDLKLCDSCDLQKSIKRCDDGGLPGIHLDCTNAIPYANEIDICNDGTSFFSTKYCFIMDEVLDTGDARIQTLEEYKTCIERTSEKQCTAWLNDKACKSCSFADSSTKDVCPDKIPGVRLDCTNLDSSVDIEICNDGTLVDIHPVTKETPVAAVSNKEPSSSLSSRFEKKDGVIFAIILSILILALAIIRVARNRLSRRSSTQGMELSSMYRTSYGPVSRPIV